MSYIDGICHYTS